MKERKLQNGNNKQAQIERALDCGNADISCVEYMWNEIDAIS